MAEQSAPPAPPPLTLDLNDFADVVNNAYANQTPMLIATANDDQPDLAFKGSFMVWDQDHLAYWERALNETLAGIKDNPRVAVLVRPKGSPPVRFYGQARVVDDSAERDRRTMAAEIAVLLEEAFAARDAAASLRRAGQ